MPELPRPSGVHVGPGVVSTGWLAANSVFEHKQEQKLGAGLVASLALHGVFLAVILYIFATHPDALSQLQDQVTHLVYMQASGPGDGGGGSLAPAHAATTAIPKVKAPDPIPLTPPDPVPPPVTTPPQIVASVTTNVTELLQAAGSSSVSLGPIGGGGTGRGIGPGDGDGIGPGRNGGTGGGIYRPGNGVSMPTKLNDIRPNYTPDAMRLKIQGDVQLEAVVRSDGTVGDVRVTRSLDRQSGLDEEAIKTVKKWLFSPALKDGKAVDVYVQIVLSFRLR